MLRRFDMADDERDDSGSTGGDQGGAARRPSGPGGNRGRPAGGGGFNRDRGFSRGGQGGRPAGGGGFNRGGGFSNDRRPFSGGAGGGGDRPFRGGSGGGDRDRGAGPAGGGFNRDRGSSGDDRPARPYGDRPARPFDRGGDRDRPSGGGFQRDDRPQRSGFGGAPGRPSGPARPYGDRPARPYGDRPDRPQRSFGGGPREGGFPDRGSGGDRPFNPRPAGGGWQDRSDRGDRFDRDDRPSGDRDGGDRQGGDRPAFDDRPAFGGDRQGGDRPAFGGDRPAYRSGPRFGGREGYRPQQRDDRFGRGSWQERGGRGPDSGDAGSGDALASPDLLALDEELVAGRRPVAEAFAARRPAKRLLVVPERRQALEQLVLHATSLRIPVVEVEGGTLTSVTGFDGHQGIALVVEPRRWATLDDVLARAAERGEPPLILVLDSLEDPQNVGTLLRTAEANGVHGVIFPTRRSAPISPAAIKTSAGATEHLLLVPLEDFAAGLVDLRSRGVRVVGADEEAQLSYRDADLRGPLALVVGSEGQGISGVVHRRLDLAVRIPMRGKIASLNAAVAGSVLLFEAASQRGTPETDRRATAIELRPEPAPATELPPATEVVEKATKARGGRKAKADAKADPIVVPVTAAVAEAAVEAPSKPRKASKAKPEPKPVKSTLAKAASTRKIATPKKAVAVAEAEPAPKAKRAAKSKTAPVVEDVVAPASKPKRVAKGKVSSETPASDDLLPEAPPAE
jgi:23S rRNA (guanosine2251-2'-O)-methyltransferase